MSQPNYQLLPDLGADEYEMLKEDIARRGVQVPVEYDECGNILDGHHRVRACQELGIADWPRIVRVGLSEDEKQEHILSLNVHRRHLTREQRAELARKLSEQGWSNVRIANALGVNEITIRRDLTGSTNVEPARSREKIVVGKDGKTYHIRPRKPSVIAKDKSEHRRVNAALEAIAPDGLPQKLLDARRVARLAREHQAQERAGTIVHDAQVGDIELWLGDFRERGRDIPDHTVDLVFTDPPYAREFLPLWSDLSAFAARVLKPSGMLIAYSGGMFLPEVMARLAEHLDYWWIGAVLMPGQHACIHSHHVFQSVKPLLFYVPHGFMAGAWFNDAVLSKHAQKDAHDWQQSIDPAEHYIECLCPPGGLVVDPFLGGGTTGVAAKLLGRSFIGIEIDPVALAVSTERIEHG